MDWFGLAYNPTAGLYECVSETRHYKNLGWGEGGSESAGRIQISHRRHILVC